MKPDILMMMPLMPDIMQRLEHHYRLHYYWQANDKDLFIKDIATSVRGMITAGTIGCARPLMDALPGLEIIAVHGIGVDAVDLHTAKARGIAVTVTPEVLTEDVADLALALMITVSRRITVADQYVRNGEWAKAGRKLPPGRKVSGKRVGIFGLGRIGKALAKRLEPMNVQISYTDLMDVPGLGYRRFETVLELAENNDFLIITASASSATHKIVNLEVLEALGPQGTLVNVARGSIVDEVDLVTALKKGSLGAAALDVFANEPKIPLELLHMPNVVLTPHIASYTLETTKAMGNLVADNLEAYFANKPLLTPWSH
jgi:lactate dehydrogenase-like 2-hydroxyacid dehydrogenase